MSKKKIKSVLLLSAAIVLGGCTTLVTSCNFPSGNNQSDDGNKGIDVGTREAKTDIITNVDELTKTWYKGDSQREITIADSYLNGKSISAALDSGDISIKTSDKTIVAVVSNLIYAQDAGSAKVYVMTASAYQVIDLTVNAPIPEPETQETKTVAELTALDATENVGKLFKVTGYITGWASGKSNGTSYGNFYIGDTDSDSNALLVYGCTAQAKDAVFAYANNAYTFTNPADWLTNEATSGLAIGDKVELLVHRLDYNTTKQLEGCAITLVEKGTAKSIPEPAKITGKTFAEVLDDTTGNYKQKFEIKGTIRTFYNKGEVDEPTAYGNFYLNDGTTDILVYGATATASALAWAEDSGSYGFTNPKDFLTNEITSTLTAGREVTMEVVRCDYGTTKKVCGIITDVTPSTDPIPTTDEPAVVTGKTLAEVMDGDSVNGLAKYEVTGTIKGWGTSGSDEAAGKYGSFVLTDGTTDVIVCGSTATDTAVTWNSTSAKYSFKNTQDFLTNELTSSLVVGQEVKMQVIRADYTKDDVTTKEVTGIILGATPVTVKDKTLAEVMDGDSVNGLAKYEVTGTIKGWGTSGTDADPTSYGNFVLTDGTTDVIVYGSTGDASKLTYNYLTSKFSLPKQKTFLTNDVTNKLCVNQTVTMEVIRCDYTKNDVTTKEVTGVITSVGDVDISAINVTADNTTIKVGEGSATLSVSYASEKGMVPGVVTYSSSDETIAKVSAKGVVTGVAAGKATINVTYGTLVGSIEITVEGEAVKITATSANYDLSKNTANSTTEITTDDLKKSLDSFYTGEDSNQNYIDSVTSVSKVYAGYAKYESLGIKLGTKSAAGVITIKSKVKVNKVVVKAAGWTTSDTIAVNEAAAQTPGVVYSAADSVKEFTFDIAASDEITFTVTNRGFITGITLYGVIE